MSKKQDLKNTGRCYDVIVVGAGLSGLSCACESAVRGKHVLVLEKQAYAGGRTSSFWDHGMHVESGMHRYIGYYSALPALLRRCGVSLKDMVTWEETAEILVKGENRKIVLGIAPLLGFVKTMRGIFGNREILSLQDKLSLLPFFVCGFSRFLQARTADLLLPASRRCGPVRHLDSFSVAEYAARHHVTPRAQRLILEPLSTGIFFMPPEHFSAYVFFGLFAPAIPKFYKMRIGAYLGGMTDVMCQPIVRKIQALGGRFRFGEHVESVIVKGTKKDASDCTGESNGCRVVGVRTSGGKEYYARHIVIAAALPAAKEILAQLKDNPALADFFRLPHMSAASIQLELDQPALKKDVTTFGPGTDMVSFAEQSRSTFRDSKGRLSIILGNPKEYARKTTEETLAAVLTQLDSLGIHLDGHVIDARKVAEEDEFYSLDKGSQHLRPRQKTSIDGLVLAGDYTLTSSFCTMEGAVMAGKKAAKACI